jgi:hypothetical protein
VPEVRINGYHGECIDYDITLFCQSNWDIKNSGQEDEQNMKRKLEEDNLQVCSRKVQGRRS